jgi:hypothetical protein
MSSVFKKLGLKDRKQILVVNSPESFEGELAALEGVEIFRAPKQAKEVGLALAFVTTYAEVNRIVPAIAKKSPGDAIVWLSYPKASSKRYKSEIKRGQGWSALGKEGFEPVSMIAIDEDWSAVRFRRVEFIKQMNRPAEHRLTEAAKRRAARKE